ncbi:hypothetical protein Pyn_33326 [Prunus yedoensis var. nudiflora]|uniref:Uncharacterized protein n=1 Tax=Prunus yedoensis var. nudiflora TaxID=2094558 RepID=A0A314XFK9_PRUYE|nr:hypothetical protein Pyn_33326 [Prunus yedoensis var. nudiflora]
MEHLSKKCLSWLEWEDSFTAFKAFFDGGVKVLMSIDELLPLCYRFEGYVTFRGALVYPEIVEALSKSVDRYGVFMESTHTLSACSRSVAFRALELVLSRMHNMQLLNIIDHRLLCWRDAICEAIPWGFTWIFFLTC